MNKPPSDTFCIRTLNALNLKRAMLDTCVERSSCRRMLVLRHIFNGLTLRKHFPDKSTPAIIDLFGSGGGLIEHRAALLANKGYVVLALAYLLYKDLPPNLKHTNLNYFQVRKARSEGIPFVSGRYQLVATISPSRRQQHWNARRLVWR